MIAAFLELHIEQAPSLVEAGKPVAICTGIPGNVRFPDVRIEGAADHVGLPRRFRRDAALAGAEFFTRLDAVWAEHDAKGVAMACTVGRFFTDPATHGMTVIPGAFRFSLDMRAYDEAVLAELERSAEAIIADVERRRSVRFHVGERARAAVGHMDPTIMAELARGARLLGLPTMQLGSPASHDAAAFATAGVPAGMLLVRNQNGSHNPREAMEMDDFLRATTLLAWWAEQRVRD